jgi:hypothetical protein
MHFETSISRNDFKIILTNHITGAEITVAGPLRGVFEDELSSLDQAGVENLGREIAHLLRKVLV